MIARFWSAYSTPEQAPAYVYHLKTRVLPELRKLEGYSSAMLLERQADSGIEIIVLTFWESLQSIRAFAGDDQERAVIADEAAALLTSFDQRTKHYHLQILDERLKEPEPD